MVTASFKKRRDALDKIGQKTEKEVREFNQLNQILGLEQRIALLRFRLKEAGLEQGFFEKLTDRFRGVNTQERLKDNIKVEIARKTVELANFKVALASTLGKQEKQATKLADDARAVLKDVQEQTKIRAPPKALVEILGRPKETSLIKALSDITFQTGANLVGNSYAESIKELRRTMRSMGESMGIEKELNSILIGQITKGLLKDGYKGVQRLGWATSEYMYMARKLADSGLDQMKSLTNFIETDDIAKEIFSSKEGRAAVEKGTAEAMKYMFSAALVALRVDGPPAAQAMAQLAQIGLTGKLFTAAGAQLALTTAGQAALPFVATLAAVEASKVVTTALQKAYEKHNAEIIDNLEKVDEFERNKARLDLGFTPIPTFEEFLDPKNIEKFKVSKRTRDSVQVAVKKADKRLNPKNTNDSPFEHAQTIDKRNDLIEIFEVPPDPPAVKDPDAVEVPKGQELPKRLFEKPFRGTKRKREPDDSIKLLPRPPFFDAFRARQRGRGAQSRLLKDIFGIQTPLKVRTDRKPDPVIKDPDAALVGPAPKTKLPRRIVEKRRGPQGLIAPPPPKPIDREFKIQEEPDGVTKKDPDAALVGPEPAVKLPDKIVEILRKPAGLIGPPPSKVKIFEDFIIKEEPDDPPRIKDPAADFIDFQPKTYLNETLTIINNKPVFNPKKTTQQLLLGGVENVSQQGDKIIEDIVEEAQKPNVTVDQPPAPPGFQLPTEKPDLGLPQEDMSKKTPGQQQPFTETGIPTPAPVVEQTKEAVNATIQRITPMMAEFLGFSPYALPEFKEGRWGDFFLRVVNDAQLGATEGAKFGARQAFVTLATTQSPVAAFEALAFHVIRGTATAVANSVKGAPEQTLEFDPDQAPTCPPGGIPRGEAGSSACPPPPPGLIPGTFLKEIDPFREGTVLTRQKVVGTPGDSDLRLTNNTAENEAILEQRKRQSLTSLPLLDLLGVNEQNRPLPEQLGRARTIYYGGVQSGFTDPLTNPFSRFVWKAKDDRYWVRPSESHNSFRRQKARQQLINLGMNEQLMYPEAARQITLKRKIEYPQLRDDVEGYENVRLYRPSYFLPQSGTMGLENAHARYHQMPNRPARLVTNLPVDKTPMRFNNRIDNYERMNNSITIQDAEKVYPFQRPRYLQAGLTKETQQA